MINDLLADGGGGSDIRLNDLGLRIPGQRSLKNIKPDTALVFTKRSFGHFCITFL
jgi:hypothetical protein